MAHAQHSSFRPMAEGLAEVPFRPVRQLSEYKGKGASASREPLSSRAFIFSQFARGFHTQHTKNINEQKNAYDLFVVA